MTRVVGLAFSVILFGCFGVRAMAQGTALPSDAQQAYLQGMSLVKAGHLDEAIQEFRRGLSRDPANPVLLNAVGATYNMKGDHARAREYFLKDLQLDPGFAPARRNLAISYFRSGRFDLASVQFQKLLDDLQSRSIASLFLGMIAEKEGKYAKAATLLGEAGNLVWNYPEAILSYGHALFETKQPGKATDVLDHLDRGSKSTASEYYQEGLLFSSNGREAEALAAFDAASRLQPQLPQLEYQRAVVLQNLGRFSEALMVLKKLTAQKPDVDSLNLLAHMAEKTGDLRLAIESYRQAAQLEPNKEGSYLGYSTLCFNYENYALALKIVDIGLSHVPNSYRLLVQKGATLDELGEHEKAEKVLRQAIKVQDDNSVALIALAVCQAHARQFQDAAETLSSAIRKFPGNYYMHYYLGTILVAMNEHRQQDPEMAEKAERQLKDAMRLNPSYADSYFQLAKLYLHENPKLAEENLLTCLKKDPQHGSAEYVLGRLYLRTGRREEGQKLVDKFLAQQEARKRKAMKTPRIEMTRR